VATINGTNLADTLNGTGSADTINAGNGNDTINAGNGNDVVFAGEGADIVFAGSGHDTVWGGAGADNINGGSGNDNLIGGDGDDILDGDDGIDWANFEGGAAVNADLTAGVATGQGTDTLLRIERLNGSSFADTLKGNAGANTLQGAAGNDLLIATAGADVLDGGADIDTVNFSGLSGINASLASGTYSSAGGTGALIGIENIVGTAAADVITGDGANNVINGGAGNDALNGGAGLDTLSFEGSAAFTYVNVDLSAGTAKQYTNAGATVGIDTVSNFENVVGTAYNDTIKGTAGANQIFAGDGTDTLLATGGVDHLDGGAGAFDAVNFSGLGAVSASLTTNAYSIDANTFGTMANIEHLVGGASNDELTGNSGANKLNGEAGADTLRGGLGNDELWGGPGSDVLIADGGDDYVVGNWSMLSGFYDAAADIFEIRTTAGQATVADFQIGVDKLDLTAFGFDANGVSANWTGSASSDNTNTQLTLTHTNGQIVKILLNGVAAGEGFSMADMIGGSSSLIQANPYPINGGNGLADTFVVVNGGVMTTGGVSATLLGFENGLDKVDLSFLQSPSPNNAAWDAQLFTNSGGEVVLHFDDSAGATFDLTIVGVTLAQWDQSDIVF